MRKVLSTFEILSKILNAVNNIFLLYKIKYFIDVFATKK